MSFGNRFKEVLKKRGITQKKFSIDTNTHAGLVSRYINGGKNPSGDFIMKAVSYFPDEVNFLLFGPEPHDKVNESPAEYAKKSPESIIHDIEAKLEDLKQALEKNK